VKATRSTEILVTHILNFGKYKIEKIFKKEDEIIDFENKIK
jgi:hypothetical protein